MLSIRWPDGRCDASALPQLLAAWSFEIEPLTLEVPVSADELWAFLQSAYYPAGLLSPQASVRLARQVSALADKHAVNGIVAWSFGLLWFAARQP